MNKIIYNNFAALADKNSTVPADGSSAYQNGGDLLNYNARNVVNYATLESRGIDLTDESLVFADSSDNLGYISTTISNLQRVTDVKLIISMTSGYYSAPGITFHFWQNIASAVSIVWLKDGQTVAEATAEPNALDFYFAKSVESFNEIQLTFTKTEINNQFIKLAGIDIGESLKITKFIGKIHVFQEIAPDCADLPANTCEFTAIIDDFEPQEMQEMFVYSDERCFGKFSAEKITNQGRNRYLFRCNDDVLALDKISAPSISDGTKAKEAVQKIANATEIGIDGTDLPDEALRGSVATDVTARNALCMVAFATGRIVKNDGILKLCKIRNRKDKLISSDRIIGKASYQTNAPYFKVVYSNTFGYGSFEIKNNDAKASNLSVKVYDQYTMMSENYNRMVFLLTNRGFRFNEITASVILEDEEVGDVISIETPFNGIKTGIIQSMDVTISEKVKIAELKIIEQDYIGYWGG